MPRIPRRKRLTRRAGWWKESAKRTQQNTVADPVPAIANPINEHSVNDPHINNPHVNNPHINNPHINNLHINSTHIHNPHISNPPMNLYPVHEQVDNDTDNPANQEYLQNAEELILHLKKHLRKPCENPLQFPEGEQ